MKITPAISTLNVDLLLEIADTIAKYPQTFDMANWDCGTTACIAGWALRLSDTRWGGRNTSADAARHLGLESRIANRLFFRLHWPDEFSHQRYMADKVGTTIARIHHFIRTGL